LYSSVPTKHPPQKLRKQLFASLKLKT
jgi:hypothetical protein